MMEPVAPFGPVYPELGSTVAKLRRGADRRAHGAAVLAAIVRLQRSALARATPSHSVHCASGSNHNKGAAILRAVAASNRAKCNPGAIRRAREPDVWQTMYEEAMAEKRERASFQLAAS